MRRGFSLVELSIVLVILGLLVGGILAGQSLIKAAELRDVSAQISKYQTATAAFRDKYFATPGDMGSATSFWGKDSALCSGATGAVATPGTCNGNANGQLENNNESRQYFQHLAMAGMIEASTELCSLAGTCPRLRFKQGNIVPKYDTNYNLSKNVLQLAGASGVTTVLFTPEEGWNLDRKWDDGMPCSGRLYMSAGSGASSACVSDNNNTCTTSPTYNLVNVNTVCTAEALIFP